MKKLREKIIGMFFTINGVLVVIVLLAILVLLASRSIPFFSEIGISAFFKDLQWNPTSYTQNTYGIRAMVAGTFMVTIGAIVIAVPISIGCAAYLAFVASSRTREILKPLIEILAGIPSVVIGFFGLVV